MRIFDRSGSRFMEFERKGDRFELKSQGFIGRYKPEARGGGWYSQMSQQQQATESPLIHDGAQTVLSTAQDARNSTNTGTTLAGPSGSGQYLFVTLSTTNVARTVTIASTNASANFPTIIPYGVLQNKPRGGEAADVGIFGISKVVAASTSILAGSVLALSSAAGTAGQVTLWTTSIGAKVGIALESPTAVNQVITAAIFSFGAGPGST